MRAKAKAINGELQLDAEFICCDLYDLPRHLDRQFDIVFTTYGTIGWLPDLTRWARIIARYLKPGGNFVFADFHPVVWMFDNAITKVEYSYFNKEAIIETEQGTYTDKSAPIALDSVGWNHSIAEVLQNLLDAGINLKQFHEFDYSPYNVFPDMVETEPGRFQLQSMPGKLPLVYALTATKG